VKRWNRTFGKHPNELAAQVRMAKSHCTFTVMNLGTGKIVAKGSEPDKDWSNCWRAKAAATRIAKLHGKEPNSEWTSRG